MRLALLDNKGSAIYDNFEAENKTCKQCFDTCREQNTCVIKCDKDLSKKRLLKLSNENGTIYICSGNEDYIKSPKSLRRRANDLTLCLHDLTHIKKEIIDEQTNITKQKVRSYIDDHNKSTQRLIHNLVSLNAHCIQEFEGLFPTTFLRKEIREQFEIISETVKDHPDKVTKLLISIAKHNVAMKTEFAVFDKLFFPDPPMKFENHVLRSVTLNVFHKFFQDFTDKNVYVNVEQSSLRTKIDYESFHVALYHIIDNTAKYVMPNSEVNVSFPLVDGIPQIIFEMMSIRIEPSELNKIRDEGYSGIHPKELGIEGKGVGLYLVDIVLGLNNANLEIIPRANQVSSIELNGRVYENNVFKIVFDRENYFQ